jgi:ketopantoate hydroxymethyltransferase
MRDEILAAWKHKKKQKKNFTIISCTEPILQPLLQTREIDCIRFDLDEYALRTGEKDRYRIHDREVVNRIQTMAGCSSDSASPWLAVDVPINLLGGDPGSAFEKVASFYSECCADILVIERQFVSLDLLKKLSLFGIPVIIQITVNGIDEKHIKTVKNQFIELESSGALMIICDLRHPQFISDMQDTMTIPVLATDKSSRSDGLYVQFARSFGLKEHNDYPQYLNLLELITGAIKDCIHDAAS